MTGMKPTKTLVEKRKETVSDENVIASVEFVIRTNCTTPLRLTSSIPFLEGLLPNRKAVEKRTSGILELHSFSSARHWTTASVRKGLEIASLVRSQNTGNIFST